MEKKKTKVKLQLLAGRCKIHRQIQIRAGKSCPGHRFNRVKPSQREKDPSAWLKTASGAVYIYANFSIDTWKRKTNNFTEMGSGLYLQQNISNDGVHVKQGISRKFSDQHVPSGERRKKYQQRNCERLATHIKFISTQWCLQVSAGRYGWKEDVRTELGEFLGLAGSPW